jgi:hypothetical protein
MTRSAFRILLVILHLTCIETTCLTVFTTMTPTRAPDNPQWTRAVTAAVMHLSTAASVSCLPRVSVWALKGPVHGSKQYDSIGQVQPDS